MNVGTTQRRPLSSLLQSQTPPRSMSLAVDLEKLRLAVSRIETRWPDHKARDEKDREALVQTMEKHRNSGDWTGCKLSLVCAAAHALFDTERRERPDLAALRQFYFDECAITDRGALLNAMLTAYIDSFSPRAEHTEKIGKALTSAKKPLPWRAAQLVNSIPGILDPAKAVGAVVREMVAAPNPYEHLVKLGLRQPHAPGLMDHAHIGFIEKISDKLHVREEADRLLAWLKPDGKPVRSSGAAEALTALLRPWIGKDPDAERQSDLTRRLVDMYGDPRRSTGDPWFRVGAEERAVFLRWLTGENLRLLFDAITDTNDSHMWAERREFYLGLHRQKRIDNVWIAFAPSGAREARRILASTGHGKGMDFGRQVAGGSRSNTSLLIAKIGRKIVVDGSHSYKVHVFDEDDPKAPKFFQPMYDCEKIRLRTPERLKKSHHSGWQQWVLMRI